MKLCTILTIFLVICRLSYGEIDLQNVEIPDIDDIEAIKERCEAKGGKGTYEKVKASKAELQECLQGLVDFEVLKNEVEEAKKTGSMDEVFGKYCAKKPKVQTCVKSFTDAIQPCLEDNEKDSLNITLNILKQLGEFVCYRDGDRIAMFVAEGGVECISSRVEGIKSCVNSTLKLNNSISTTSISSTSSLPVFLIDKQKCDDFGKLQACVVADLEKCKSTTPANIVDALFRFVKRSACNNKSKRSIHKIFKRGVEVLHKVYNPETEREKVLDIIKDKCRTNAGPNGFNQLTTSIHSTIKCFKTEVMSNSAIQDFSISSDEFKKITENCTSDSFDKLQKCLPDHEKSYVQFNKRMLFATIDFIINNKDRILDPELKSSCLRNFSTQGNLRTFTKCAAGVQGEVNENTLFDTTVACQRMNGAKKCLSDLITDTCESDVQNREKIKKLLEDGFTALKAPCDHA